MYVMYHEKQLNRALFYERSFVVVTGHLEGNIKEEINKNNYKSIALGRDLRPRLCLATTLNKVLPSLILINIQCIGAVSLSIPSCS